MIDLKAPALGGAIFVTTTTAIAISSSGPHYLKLVEVHFYDKNNGTPVKIRLSLENIDQDSYLEIQEGNDWKYLSAISSDTTKASQIPKWNTLFNIASYYIRAQHYLNLVKNVAWNNRQKDSSSNNADLNTLCKDKTDCCCQGKKCEDGECSTCICCYADNAPTDCCCKADSSCTWTEFQKTQNTFNYLLNNTHSIYTSTYLHPLQVQIKLTDTSFNDLEYSSGDTVKEEYKPFIGSMIYGFVDYEYKEATSINEEAILSPYKSSGKDDASTQFSTLSGENAKLYFANIPQRFQFLQKTKSANGASSVPKDDIKEIFDQIKEKSTINKKAKEITDVPDKCCGCCKEEGLDCIIKRNYVFAEKKSELSKIQDRIKKAKDCCATTP